PAARRRSRARRPQPPLGQGRNRSRRHRLADGADRVAAATIARRAGVPEWPKGAGCKPAGSAFGGSNPPPCTPLSADRKSRAGVPIAARPLKRGSSAAAPATGDDAVKGRARLLSLALLAQSVEHLHGKEGVDGSSPSEGLAPAKALRSERGPFA